MYPSRKPTTHTRSFTSAVILTLAVPLCSGHAIAQWSVTSLHPPAATSSRAYALGSGGIAGSTGAFLTERAAYWNSASSGGYVDLNPAGASRSTALGASGGQQVGSATFGEVEQAFLWSGSSSLAVNLAPNGAYSQATAISGSQQVGWAGVGGRIRASLWNGTSSSWQDLHPYGPGGLDEEGDNSFAYGVGDGHQVGYFSQYTRTESRYHAALWSGSAASLIDLHPAHALDSFALAVSGTQQVGYAYIGSYTRALLWTGSASSSVDLTPSGAFNSIAYGVASGYQVGVVDGRAAIWNGTAATFEDLGAFLPVTGANSVASGVWSDGTTLFVSGYGAGPSGIDHAYLWSRPIPAPSSAGLLLLAAASMHRRRRASRRVPPPTTSTPRPVQRQLRAGVCMIATACTLSAASGQSRFQISQASVTGTAPIEQSNSAGSATVQAIAQAPATDGWTLRSESIARAEYGVLRASAAVQGSGPLTGNSSFAAYAFARASFEDALLMTPADPNRLGTAGIMTASILISGTMDASWAGNFWSFGEGREPTAGYTLEVGAQTFSGSIARTYGDTVFNPPQTLIENALPRLVTFELPFTFGQSSPLSVAFQLSATAQPFGDSAELTAFGASVLAFNSSVWQGISHVRSLSGEPIPASQWTLSSASGTNYGIVLPTPASAILFGLGARHVSRRRRA